MDTLAVFQSCFKICRLFNLNYYSIIQMDIFDVAQRYAQDKRPLVVLAGKEYGSGSSRDWAAKGPWILVKFKTT